MLTVKQLFSIADKKLQYTRRGSTFCHLIPVLAYESKFPLCGGERLAHRPT